MRVMDFFDDGLSPFSQEYRDRLNEVAYAALGFADIEEAIEVRLATPIPDFVRIPPQPFTALLGVGVPLTDEVNQWDYPWVTGWVDADTGKIIVDEDEDRPVGTIADGTAARNDVEQLNDAIKAAHGLPLPPVGDPNVTATVLAIPEGTPVVMFQVRRSDGERTFRFSEVNAVDFQCVSP